MLIMVVKKNNINTYTLNKNKLIKINNDAKKHTTTIENIIKMKLQHEFNNANIYFCYLKLHCDFDIFKNNDYFFTGLFKYNKNVYDIKKDKKTNKVFIQNKDNKKEFTEFYLNLCKEITKIGEILFIEKINKLENKTS